jgi:2'-hydroxyisoflavone reductase
MNRRNWLRVGVAGAAAACTAGAREDRREALRILILGGTGFIGPYQVRRALERGHDVTVFNRGRRPMDWPGKVRELTGDRETGDLKSLEQGEWDVCIDNPTSAPVWVRDAGKVLAGRVKQYLYISSISAYADTSKPGMREDAPLARYEGADVMKETHATLRADMSLYGPLKAACEAEAERRFPGMTTVVRPGLIVGPGDDTDRFTYWPVRIARGGKVLAPPADDPVQFIDVRDLCEWIIGLAERRAFGAYHAIGPARGLTVAAFLEAIRRGVKADAEFVHAPADFLRQQGVRPWADLPVWLPGQGGTAGFARMDPQRAIAAGLTFRPLEETAAATWEWFRGLPQERRSQLRAGLDAGREAAVLKALEDAEP